MYDTLYIYTLHGQYTYVTSPFFLNLYIIMPYIQLKTHTFEMCQMKI